MAVDNPDITANDIIDDVENRLDTPNLGSDMYLPWVSYSYQKLFNKISQVGRNARETFFGAVKNINMNTTDPNEYSLETEIPRFGGFIKVEVKYGASGDVYNDSTKISSISKIRSMANTSTTYWSKDNPHHYVLGDLIGFLPVPPETGAIARVWYVKRPNQIVDGADVLEIPYRFLYPVTNYVQAMAIRRANQDYTEAALVEKQFERELEEVADTVASEFSDEEGEDAVEVDSNSPIYRRPF